MPSSPAPPRRGANIGFADPLRGANIGFADPRRGANIGFADPLRGANIGFADVPCEGEARGGCTHRAITCPT
jgi:hypothetical protein